MAGGREVCRLRQEYKLALQHEVKLCPKAGEVPDAKSAVCVSFAQEMVLWILLLFPVYYKFQPRPLPNSRCVRSSTSREEMEFSRRYSHGRLDPAILLVALEFLLQKTGEESTRNDCKKQTPPVRNDIKLQRSPFQDKKSYSLNPGSFLGFLPPTTSKSGSKNKEELEAAKLNHSCPPPPRKTLASCGVFFPRFGK